MKITATLLMLFVSCSAYAGGKQPIVIEKTVIEETCLTENTFNEYNEFNEFIDNSSVINGQVAMGLATAQHHFDPKSKKLQGSVGMGHYGNQSAVSFALGQKVKGVLVNGSVSLNESGDRNRHGFGVGVNWEF